MIVQQYSTAPGTPQAHEGGCTCANLVEVGVHDGRLTFPNVNDDCPLHGIAAAVAYLNSLQEP